MRLELLLLVALASAGWLTAGLCSAGEPPAGGHLGILAYGSLIEDPGEEIGAATLRRTPMKTPFAIEFGRSSRTRGGAPTLVPVKTGGAAVNAVLLVLKDSVSEDDAASMLWRRETRQKDNTKQYVRPKRPKANSVLVESVTVGGIKVLYTDFAPSGKLKNPTAEQLAEFAVTSARDPAVPEGRDGISYLISAKRAGIRTPLMPDYEKNILRITGAATLEEALTKSKAGR
jgi:hypothetical protein